MVWQAGLEFDGFSENNYNINPLILMFIGQLFSYCLLFQLTVHCFHNRNGQFHYHILTFFLNTDLLLEYKNTC